MPLNSEAVHSSAHGFTFPDLQMVVICQEKLGIKTAQSLFLSLIRLDSATSTDIPGHLLLCLTILFSVAIFVLERNLKLKLTNHGIYVDLRNTFYFVVMSVVNKSFELELLHPENWHCACKV